MARQKRASKLDKVSKQVGIGRITKRHGRRPLPEATRIRTIGKTGGRQKGTPNRLPTLLKDALIEAATNAGLRLKERKGESLNGLVRYLTHQAINNPQSFLPLLGKVLPLQIDTGGVPLLQVNSIEFVVLQPGDDPGQYKTGLIEIDGTCEASPDGERDSDGDS